MLRDVFIPDPVRSTLLVVDVQTKLAPTMPEKHFPGIVKNIALLIALAKEDKMPILVTEQYPAGLGATIPELKELLADIKPIEKVAFSCMGVPEFVETLRSLNRDQVILTGIEAHVCVLQTALDLLDTGFEVFLPADGVCSRAKFFWKMGMDTLREAGAIVGSTDQFFFGMIKEAGNDRFKRLSKLVK